MIGGEGIGRHGAGAGVDFGFEFGYPFCEGRFERGGGEGAVAFEDEEDVSCAGDAVAVEPIAGGVAVSRGKRISR